MKRKKKKKKNKKKKKKKKKKNKEKGRGENEGANMKRKRRIISILHEEEFTTQSSRHKIKVLDIQGDLKVTKHRKVNEVTSAFCFKESFSKLGGWMLNMEEKGGGEGKFQNFLSLSQTSL